MLKMNEFFVRDRIMMRMRVSANVNKFPLMQAVEDRMKHDMEYVKNERTVRAR